MSILIYGINFKFIPYYVQTPLFVSRFIMQDQHHRYTNIFHRHFQKLLEIQIARTSCILIESYYLYMLAILVRYIHFFEPRNISFVKCRFYSGAVTEEIFFCTPVSRYTFLPVLNSILERRSSSCLAVSGFLILLPHTINQNKE